MRALLIFAVTLAVSSADDCTKICTADYTPVCGSNGRTYGNQCDLDVAICRNSNIRLAHTGACDRRPGPLPAVDPPRRPGTGQLPPNCRMNCPLNFDPVCGTDGTTYPNECSLTSISCRQRRQVQKAHDGACTEVEAAEGDGCIKPCPRMFRPVCGSDGITYSNNCMLEIASCRSNGEITLASAGRCCPRGCNRRYQPVCGSDGNTYGNACTLRMASCERVAEGGSAISQQSEGACSD